MPISIIGGGGGVVNNIDDVQDVVVTNPQNGQALVYDANSQQWINQDVTADVQGDILAILNTNNKLLWRNNAGQLIAIGPSVGNGDQVLVWPNETAPTFLSALGATNRVLGVDHAGNQGYLRLDAGLGIQLNTTGNTGWLISTNAILQMNGITADANGEANMRLSNLQDMNSTERLNFVIPAGASENMTDWMNNNNYLQNAFPLLGNNNNPFSWGNWGDPDYGTWHIQNNDPAPANTSVNIPVALSFLSLQFVQTIIQRLAGPDLLNIRIRPSGILLNSDNTVTGEELIAPAADNNIGRFKKLVAGNNITLTSNEGGITIASTAGGITTVQVKDIADTQNMLSQAQIFRYDNPNNGNVRTLVQGNGISINQTNTLITINNTVRSLSSQEDVFLLGLVDGDTIKYVNANNRWERIPYTISSMNDVTFGGITLAAGHVMLYDEGAQKWINSNRLLTAETQIQTLNDNVQTLVDSNWQINLGAPVPTPYTVTYDQTLRPIIRAQYTAFSPVIPRTALGGDATTDVAFLNTGNTANVNGTVWEFGVYQPLTDQQAREAFFKGTFTAQIQANYGNNFVWLSNLQGANNSVMKVRYEFAPHLPIGTYTNRLMLRGLNNPTRVRVYFLKNAALAQAWVADRTFNPPAIGHPDYDLLLDLAPTAAAQTLDTNYTTTREIGRAHV